MDKFVMNKVKTMSYVSPTYKCQIKLKYKYKKHIIFAILMYIRNMTMHTSHYSMSMHEGYNMSMHEGYSMSMHEGYSMSMHEGYSMSMHEGYSMEVTWFILEKYK